MGSVNKDETPRVHPGWACIACKKPHHHPKDARECCGEKYASLNFSKSENIYNTGNFGEPRF